MENRITDLEFKISHQEVLLEELNQVVRKQQETIDKLEASIKFLGKLTRDAGIGAPEVGPGDQKPPHY